MQETTRWAACPRAENADSNHEPKLFNSKQEAAFFLESEVPLPPAEIEADYRGVSVETVLEGRRAIDGKRKEADRKVAAGEMRPHEYPRMYQRKKNKDHYPFIVPVAQPASGSSDIERLKTFIPLDLVGDAHPITLKRAIKRALDGDALAVESYLSNEWRFEQIIEDCLKRRGHDFEGKQIGNLSKVLMNAVYDLDSSVRRFHPSLDAPSLANFFRSWQVWRHIAEFCDDVVEVEPYRTDFIFNSAGIRASINFIYRQLRSYAHHISPPSIGSGPGAYDASKLEVEAIIRDARGSVGPLTSTDALKSTPFHTRLKEWIAKSGTKHEAIAEIVKVAVRTFYRHLSGKSLPRTAALDRYERLFRGELP